MFLLKIYNVLLEATTWAKGQDLMAEFLQASLKPFHKTLRLAKGLYWNEIQNCEKNLQILTA